ncbi:GATOR complex protein DEPDC5-like isoform X2 [Ostrea edulis]|uniref:GATOR complex protein DEPDC5-like isoform X2 n=1 Tax=Ostrea edulis TaxID=37623 RepID=UPI0024AF47CC|nr:GATOR complex protein DEPDC5-like isoform X2 [Ostrea edulis]
MAKTLNLRVHKRSYSENSNLNEEILINQKDVSDVVVGDVVEIYHIEDEESRLLLQVASLSDEFQQKGIVSIEQSIATTFQLRAYKDVIVKKVDPKSVSLDLVEMLFKDQYFSRSDFWRLRNGIIDSCVYLNKKIEHAEMRPQVMEMWSRGERVMCGTITEETRIVYRSSTAVVQIFIQMSSEMWDFDILGEDLYFEKALNGFLTDLFAKWKEQNCLHDVTIVLFSRTFYKAQSLEDFPDYMRDCIVCDYKGRYYQDFYRIVVQNERYDDWTTTMMLLRKLCNTYKDKILNYHRQRGHKVPVAYNSRAAQGNFLETLNMSLNLFEGYYIDRNFDRTGKVAVVITPGAGVFEVDRELANITKQRTIDCGVGSDLVCMGEQPLHAAPLFKFHNKHAKNSLEVGDDYNIPHWMNHSFYISKSQIKARLQGSFIPRIKPPPEFFEAQRRPGDRKLIAHSPNQSEDEDNFPFVDYDEYDAQIWKLPTPNSTRFGSLKSPYHARREPQTLAEAKQIKKPRKRNVSDEYSSFVIEKGERRGSPAINIPTLARSSSTEDVSSSVGCYPIVKKISSKESNNSSETEETYFSRRIVGSAESPVGYSRRHIHQAKSRRALINPFAPSRMQFKMTSNRRRWVHAFPTDPQGAAVQTHHFHVYNKKGSSALLEKLSRESAKMSQLSMDMKKQPSFTVQDSSEKCSEPSSLNRAASGLVTEEKEFYVGSVDSCKSISPTSSLQNLERFGHSSSLGSTNYSSTMDGGLQGGRVLRHKTRENRSYLWGPTGEQEWSPDMTTGQDWFPAHGCQTESRLIKPILTADIHSQNFCAGISVDWKSLTMPASLPITTDYFPDKRSLENDYTVSQYTLIPEDVNSEYYSSPPVSEDDRFYRRKPLLVTELFRELISQRLAQGFQIITKMKATMRSQETLVGSSPQYPLTSSLIRARPRSGPQEEIYLSIGLIFHKLTLSGQTIQVTQYRPRHEQRQLKYLYRYRFQVPDSLGYDISTSEFRNEKLENYNWNYLDQYICTRGEGDYGLLDPLKYWRARFFLLPCNNPATKKIIEGNDRRLFHRCDIYKTKSKQELQQLISGFVRFLETLNKIRRTAQTRRPKHSGDNVSTTPSTDQQTAQTSQKEAVVLSTSMPSSKLVEAMRDPQTGLPMIPKQTGLPENCFIAEEAVDWCIQNIQEVKDVGAGIHLMQRLQDEHYVCHSSGNAHHKFIHGFYLYNIVSPKDKPKSDMYGPVYNYLFQNEWCEVSILPVERERSEIALFTTDESPCQVSELWVDQSCNDWRTLSGIDSGAQGWGQLAGSRVNLCAIKATLTHKYVHVEVDVNNRSDRPEWASARYHAYYSPNAAFELQIQWMVATGSILGDLVTTWGRKAQACGFHLLPVPGDPFALPSAPDSDPLRGPIFVPLDIASLSQGGKAIFHELDSDAKSKKLFHFQDEIIKRYGFMPINVCVSPTHRHDQTDDQQQYIHCTGGMFSLIESSHLVSPKVVKTTPSRFSKKSAGELRKDYIARQNSNTSSSDVVTKNKTGFLWSWNFMSSKRWRSPNTGDESFQDKMLADFRQFCANENNRLTEFWNDFKMSAL